MAGRQMKEWPSESGDSSACLLNLTASVNSPENNLNPLTPAHVYQIRQHRLNGLLVLPIREARPIGSGEPERKVVSSFSPIPASETL